MNLHFNAQISKAINNKLLLKVSQELEQVILHPMHQSYYNARHHCHLTTTTCCSTHPRFGFSPGRGAVRFVLDLQRQAYAPHDWARGGRETDGEQANLQWRARHHRRACGSAVQARGERLASAARHSNPLQRRNRKRPPGWIW